MPLSPDGDTAESPEKKKKRGEGAKKCRGRRDGKQWRARDRSGSVSTKYELHEWCGVYAKLDKSSVPR
jgi:hypothetical protein